MAFVSYSQNFEDVMLWRALKHVENGFYVDIGAQDPIVDSVSFAFYEHGWRGVHVEPTQQYSEMLLIARPDERVFQVAIGQSEDIMTFYEFEDTGLSTADWEIAQSHKNAGFICNKTMVPVISLDSLFESLGVKVIHWLKLDVEGMEKAVLKSWEKTSIIPWVLVIESTRPSTQQECHADWEHLLLGKGYQFVYFDGLNRFYVSANHVDLAVAFLTPPNIFDGFVLSGTASQPFCKLIESKAQQAESKAQQAIAASDEYQARLMSIDKSTSWRITKPLRWTLDHLRSQRIPSDLSGLKQLVKAPLLPLIRLVGSQPKLKDLVIRSAARLRVSGRLRSLYWSSKAVPTAINSGFPMSQDFRQLSPRARHIYAGLKQAIEQHHEDIR